MNEYYLYLFEFILIFNYINNVFESNYNSKMNVYFRIWVK